MQVEVADGMGGTKIVEKETALTAGGLRRTLDNKNPVNAGIDNVKPALVSIIEALTGKKKDSEFLPEGKILGTFNNPNYKDLSFFGKLKADASRQKELKQLQKEFELQEKLKEQIRQEAQAAQRQSDQARVDRAYREETGGQAGSYATGESGVQSDKSYNDPFDPGGGEKDGGFIDGANRRKYDDGGRVAFKGGGMDASQDDFGGGAGGSGTGGGDGGDPRSDYMGMKGKIGVGPRSSRQGGPTMPLITLSPVITPTYSPMDIPNVGLESILGNRARIQAMLNTKRSLTDKKPVGDITFETAIGPVDVTGISNLQGLNNLNLSTGMGPFGVNFNTDLAGTNTLGFDYGIGSPFSVTGSTNLNDEANITAQLSYPFKDGGLASMFVEKR